MNLLTLASWSVRISGLIVLVLGLVIWVDALTGVTGVHMLVGLILVISLWVVSVLAARAGAPLPLVAVALLWGALTVALGLFQAQILPGEMHWIVEVGHLAVGLVAIGLAEMLNARAQEAAAPA